MDRHTTRGTPYVSKPYHVNDTPAKADNRKRQLKYQSAHWSESVMERAGHIKMHSNAGRYGHWSLRGLICGNRLVFIGAVRRDAVLTLPPWIDCETLQEVELIGRKLSRKDAFCLCHSYTRLYQPIYNQTPIGRGNKNGKHTSTGDVYFVTF